MNEKKSESTATSLYRHYRQTVRRGGHDDDEFLTDVIVDAGVANGLGR